MILSHSASWIERARIYEGLTDVAADFAINTPEWRCAGSIFSQTPRPSEIIIGRGANKPTQQYTVGASVAQNADAYQINLTQLGATVTNPITFTSDASATLQEINNGLLTALNAIVGKNYTAAFSPLASLTPFTFTANSVNDQCTATAHGLNTGDGPVQVSNSGGALPAGLSAATNYWIIKIDANTFEFSTSLANALLGTQIDLTTNGTGTQTLTPQAGCVSPILPFLVTGNAAGNWFSLEVLDTLSMTIKQTHADPGIAADLTTIQLQNDSWYVLITLENSKAVVQAAAAYIETQTKLYFPDVNETDALNTVLLAATDTYAALKTSSYLRTAPCYHPSPAAFFAAGWLGRVLPIDPGGDDWKWKTIAGVPTVVTTATQRSNLRARSANTYEAIPGRSITWEGTVCSGDFIDNVRGKDWIIDDMSKGVYAAMGQPNKTPDTDNGIAVVENEVRASLKRAAKNGIITADSIVVTVPKAAAQSTNDRALRILRDVDWAARLQGAVHSCIITGTISA